MSEERLRTVKYSPEVDVKFEKVALKLGRSKRVVFVQMVDYFYRSKKDPLDVNDELLKNTLLKQHRDYVGFIKTQETELLVPIKREVARMIENQKKLIEAFNTEVFGANDKLLKGQKGIVEKQERQAQKFAESDELIRMVQVKMRNAEQLKRQFLLILEGYIKRRDAFGIMTPAKEKEELILTTRQQVKLL